MYVNDGDETPLTRAQENEWYMMVEPIIWVRPSSVQNGKYVYGLDGYFYGTWANFLAWANSNMMVSSVTSLSAECGAYAPYGLSVGPYKDLPATSDGLRAIRVLSAFSITNNVVFDNQTFTATNLPENSATS